MIVLFWICTFILYYIYDGYLRLLRLLPAFHHSENSSNTYDISPKVTVLVTVFNAEGVISDRIRNILDSDYQADKIEIIVASDGSDDRTDEIINTFGGERVRLFRPNKRIGKTDTQNRAIAWAKGEIVIFTDADTRFERTFLRRITSPFSDPQVGGVDGHLFFIKEERSGISKSQGFYWDYELKLRQLESRIGILAVASGACLAIRRDLFHPMGAEYGEDCIVPLDIVLQGYKIIHASDAIAFDQMEHKTEKEFQTRVRMTIRNLQGTFSKGLLLNPLRAPGYALALWSHKILRWFSPIFLILLTISSIYLIDRSNFFYFSSFLMLFFYASAFLGWIAERRGWRIPLANLVFSFVLANLGFLVGIIKAICGHRITAYRQS
jgi:cellulose synthase/poly-beta-1,6-N-acetylglucosamine synthase-like glycosyltransferase